MDVFLTQINSLPQDYQIKLMQEKILLLNEKLINYSEEFQQINKFHKMIVSLFDELNEKFE